MIKAMLPFFLKALPVPVSKFLRRLRTACLGFVTFVWNGKHWSKVLATARSGNDSVMVCYGHVHVPGSYEKSHGGLIKFQRLQGALPNSPSCFNILYLGSSSLSRDWRQICWLARRKKVGLVLNQNGVAYPGWHGPGWEETNRPIKTLVHEADYVFYQSKFCKDSADLFLGERSGPWEILYNCVDTNVFTPRKANKRRQDLVLLLGGNQYQYYRIETALRTIAILAKAIGDLKLIITGRLCWIPNEKKALGITRKMAADFGVLNRLEFLGPYFQSDAPDIFRKADILLHTKYNDPCPGLVVEAMACGLPVVYSKSGGVPELVGEDAGIDVPVEQSYDRDIPPDPEELAHAVVKVAENRKTFSQAARQRAVENFDIVPWVRRHKEVFEELLR